MGRAHYDPRLNEILGGNNHGSSIALNRHFSRWAGRIEEAVQNRDDGLGDFYKMQPDRGLLKACKQHAYQHARRVDAPEVVVLVHPLYLSFSDMDLLTAKTERQAHEYLQQFMGFLERRPDSSRLGVVVLDTVHHYAAGTSLLLEQGKVDQVLFTQFDRGNILHPRDLNILKGRTIFIGGGYNGRCLQDSINDLKPLAGSEDALTGLIDLVLTCPNDNYSNIRPRHVIDIPKKAVITSAELLDRLKAESRQVSALGQVPEAYPIAIGP